MIDIPRASPVKELGAFAQHWRELLAAGYSPIPCGRNTKRPLIDRWTQHCETPLSEARAAWLAGRMSLASLGICLRYNGLIGIDYDGGASEAENRLRAWLPPSPAVKIHRPHRWTAFYRTARPIRTRHLLGFDGLGFVDVLADRAMTIIPPSLHPRGGQYRWLGDEGLLSFPGGGALPLLPDDVADRIAALLAPWLRKRADPPQPEPRQNGGAAAEPLTDLAARRMKAFAEAGLRRQKAIVSEMGDGGRGHALNRMMISLGVYIREEILTHEEVVAAGLEACAVNGLLAERGTRDILVLIERGLAYAAAHHVLPNLDREKA